MVMLRFDEPTTEVLPSDAEGALEDLRAPEDATLPEVVHGIVGYAREFVAGDDTLLQAQDTEDGSSLFTRTVSIRTILRWDFDDQVAAGGTGLVVRRGIGGSSSERTAYGFELRVVNAAARIGEVRLYWESLAGVRFTAPGGQFRLTRASETMLITAVRRWSSTRDVVVRYYVGDQLLNEAVADDGEIGGGTTGTLQIGGAFNAGVMTNAFEGAIDELHIVGREIVAEEVEATWRRIRVLQPAGEQLIRDCMPPGLPISDDPDSRVQREIKWMGQALGYSSAQIENQRHNLHPLRAYGRALERWEKITRQAVRPGDDVDVRRRRVQGHLARRAGISQPGVRAAMQELLACGGDQLELIAYSNIIRDSFDVMRERRWRRTPSADWTVAGGELAIDIAAGQNPAALTSNWRLCLTGLSGPERLGGYGGQIFAKVTPAFTDDGMEAGLVLYDWGRKDALLLGLRRDGGDTKVVSQRYVSGVAQAVVEHATSVDAPHWLHLYQVPLEYSGQERADLVAHAARWSSTSDSAGFTTVNPGDFAFSVGWIGFYARTFNGALGDPLAATFDDAALWMPHGTRPFHFYVVRDPDLPGEYDLGAANSSIAKLKQSQTHGAVVTSRAFLAGNPESLCGRGPCGE